MYAIRGNVDWAEEASHDIIRLYSKAGKGKVCRIDEACIVIPAMTG